MIEYANQSTLDTRFGPMKIAGWAASAIAWAAAALFVLALVGGVVLLMSAGKDGYPGAIASPLVSFTLLLVIASAARDVRRRRSLAALVYLEQAVRLNLPLTPMLAAARLAERPGTARRILHLEELIAAGTSVADAVDAALPELPPRLRHNLRSAERLGRLPETLARLADRQRPIEPHDPTRAFYRSYPLLLLAAISLIVMILTIFVLPKFQDIFHDFHLPMPALTQSVLSFATLLVPVIAAGSTLLILLLATRALWDTFVPRRPRVTFRWITDPVEWILPLLGRSAMDRGMADVCFLLADAADAGLPLDQAIAEAERLDLNLLFRRRIVAWRTAVQHGSSLPDAARAARLPHVLTGLLDTTPADLPGLFRFLARYYAARFSRAQALLRAATLPAIAIAMGIVVALVGLSLFLPLIALIDRMSPRIGSVL